MKTISKILSIVLVLSMVLGFALVGTAAETKLATFTFPANTSNSSVWQDGTEFASKSFTDGSYSLSFTSGTKVYANGNDQNGKGFIKFGTSSATGTLTFTVPADVTRVELHLSGYKSNKAYYTINSTAGSTTKTSSTTAGTASQYDVVSVDTSANKTITLATTSSGKRMVMFSVIYYGGASDTPSCEHDNATYIKTMAGHTMDCPDCDDSFTAQDHTYTNKVCSVCGYELYTPAHLDKVTIYYPTDDCYMSGTASGSKLAAGSAQEFVVVVNGSNYEFVTAEGKYLTSGATGNSLTLTAESGTYTLWTLEETTNGWYIKNVNAAYNGSAQYLEFWTGFTTYGLGSGGEKFTFLFEKTGVATEVPEFQCPHVDANSDYLCDNNCGEVLDPAADSALTLEEANKLGLAHTSGYTTNKYYVTGIVTEIVSDQYGNLWIEDADGVKFYIYGTYSADGSTRYDALDTIPGVGDEVTLYGVIGQYSGAAQMKSGWLDELVVHTCVDDVADHKCDICDETISECEDADKDHACDTCDETISECEDADKDHACDTCDDTISECEDAVKDHACDTCEAEMGDHTVDADGDHKCDYCDATISGCEFNSADFITTKDGHSQSCTCGEVGEEEPHVDADGDYICDVCEYELDVPKTGDISLLPAVIMAVLSASGMGLVIKKKIF